MNKRQCKKRNKTRHMKLLSMLPYKVTLATFGSGYFIFEKGANAICWFWLKEFPSWKFGIWLEGKRFDIFGEAKSMIDKFKPTRTELSKTNIYEFIDELHKIENNHPDWESYRLDAITCELSAKREHTLNLERYKAVYAAAESLCCDMYRIEIQDRNTRDMSISPRYMIYEYMEDELLADKDKSLEASLLIYKTLCEALELHIDQDDEFYLDSFIFSSFSQMVTSPTEIVRESERYNRDPKNLEEHLEALYLENKMYAMDADSLKKTIASWKKTNYPDTPTLPGYLEALERCYEGKYNILLATKLVTKMFTSPEECEWLNG